MHYGGRLTPEQFWARFDAREREIRADADVLPCRGLAGWPGRLGLEWSRVDGALATVGLVHSAGEPGAGETRVTVLISTEARDDLIANRRLNAVPPTPASKEHTLEALRQATSPPIGTVTVSVDGQPEEFDHWVDGPHWFAARTHGAHTLAIEARHIRPEELTIVRTPDIEPYLAGSRATLRHTRGED